MCTIDRQGIRCLRLQRAHDVLDPRVLFEAVHAEVLAVAALLGAAVRHLSDDRDVGVHPDATKIKVSGTSHCSGNIDGQSTYEQPEV